MRASGPRAGGRPALSPLTRMTVIANLLGALFLCVIAFEERLFLPQGQLWLLAAGVGLATFPAAILLRGRETETLTRVQSYYTLGLCALCCYFTADDRIVAAGAPAIGIITLGGAMRLPRRSVWPLLAVALLASLLVMHGSGLEGVALAAGEIMAVGLTCVPALTVLYYRRQLEDAVAQLQEQATRDALTGLSNRRGLLEQAPLLFAEAVQADRWIAVLLADVDHFKQLNDLRGHLAGDEMLRTISRIVERSMRHRDIVARYGGEELCMVAMLEDVAELHSLAERVRGNVEAGTGGVTVSIGAVARQPRDADATGEGFFAMVGEADRLLYDAKAAGRNATRVAA